MLIEMKFEVSEKFPDFFAAMAQTVDFPNLDSTGARQTLRITEPAKTLPGISLLRFFFGLSKPYLGDAVAPSPHQKIFF